MSDNENKKGVDWARLGEIGMMVLSVLGRAIAWLATPVVKMWRVLIAHHEEHGFMAALTAVGLGFLATVSAWTTFRSVAETIFAVSGSEKYDFMSGDWFVLGMGTVVVPLLFAVGFALLILRIKVGIMQMPRNGLGSVVKLCVALVVLVGVAFTSMLFNYDYVFRGTNEGYFVSQRQTEAYNAYSGYLTRARSTAAAQLATFEKESEERLATLVSEADLKKEAARNALPLKLEEMRVRQAAEIAAIEKQRDDRQVELGGVRDEAIAKIEKRREERVPKLRQHLAARRIETSQELAKLRAQLESETKGLVGDNLSGVAGKGTRAKAIEAQLADAAGQVEAELKSKEKALAEEEARFEAEIAAVREDWDRRMPESFDVFQKRIDDLSARHQSDQLALQDEMGKMADDEQKDLEQALLDERKRFKEREDKEKARLQVYLTQVDLVMEELSVLSECKTLECVVGSDARLGTLVLPLGPLVAEDLPKVAMLPPMFSSMNLFWGYISYLRGDGERPTEVGGIVLAVLIAVVIDLGDAPLILFPNIGGARRRREEEEEQVRS